MEEIGEIVGGGTPDTKIEEYWNGDIPWISSSDIFENSIHQIDKTRFIKEKAIKETATKLIPKNSVLIVSRVGIGKFAIADEELCTSQDFSNFITNQNSIFAAYCFKSNVNKFLNLSQGTSIKGFTTKDIKSAKFLFPSIEEQTKIADFLFKLDERIQTQRESLEELISMKNAIRRKLFNQIRKEEFDRVKIGNLLNYEQPTKYIVADTNYSEDNNLTPVLTANKAFVLGYTIEKNGIYDKGNCIILDDFTMDLKYVDFPFKIKSSAIKILTPKPNTDLIFIFEYLIYLNLTSYEHKRHYISEIQQMEIQIPKLEMQNKISRLLSRMSTKLQIEQELLSAYEQQKKYFLQNMFV